ncbi:hypothetical protein EV714DRAFT_278157 [Schizophyllum commune]
MPRTQPGDSWRRVLRTHPTPPDPFRPVLRQKGLEGLGSSSSRRVAGELALAAVLACSHAIGAAALHPSGDTLALAFPSATRSALPESAASA